MKFTGERFVPTESLDLDLEIEHLHRYYSITDLVKNKIVVDAACGEGYGSYLLAHHAALVHGVDISEEAIYHAKDKYNRTNLTFVVDSIASLPFENNSIDVLISFETIEHVNEQLQSTFLNEIKRVLKHDGILVMSTPNKLIYSDIPQYKNQFHVKEFYREEFVSFLETNFSNVNIFEQDFQVISMINNKDEQTFKKMPFKKQAEDIGKYLIAVCSNINISNISIGSVVLDEDNKLQKSSKRIIQLQTEEEDRNLHINRLDREIAERDREIKERDREIAERDKVIVERDKVIVERDKIIVERDKIIVERDTVIADNNINIYNLKEKEQILNTILQSNGWRLLEKYYHIRDGILPLNSKRRLFSKLLLNFFKNPRLYSDFISMKNVNKAIYYLRTEDLSRLKSRIEDYCNRHTVIKEDEVKLFVSMDFPSEIIFKQVSNPLVSIIIPVHNQWSYTYSCLTAILENTSNISYEIIVADDVSNDETININQYVQNIKAIRNDKNLGFLLNCNNAAKYAQGKYILFLNNDTNVQVDWLKHLVDLIESDESIGMVGSKLIYADGRLQEAGGIIWRDASGWNYGRCDDANKSEYNYVKEVDYISGASIMIRSSLWEKIGGFDERYVPAYFEDADLAFEVRNAGYRVVYQPKSVVVHFEGISNGTDIKQGIKSYQVKNQEKFIEKWKSTLESDHYPNSQDVFWAKDRSKNKKTIIVIDHYVPHYDKDAGGKCTYQYLKLFLEMGLHVIFLGDNFFKHEPYATQLEQQGIQVLYGEWYKHHIQEWLIDNSQYIDYAYLNRPHIAIQYINILKKYFKAKIIYFGHDLHYLREQRQYDIEKNPELLKSSQEWKKMEFDLFEKADVIHVVGSYEQAVIQREFPSKNIRNIPLYIYNNDELNQETRKCEDTKDILYVGGFNHKPNVDAVVWFVQEIFPLILAEKPNIKFYVVGSSPPDMIRELATENIRITGFISDEELRKYYEQCRIVVVPLRYGAGVKGKVVEAMYYQVPIVTTSIGAEGLEQVENILTIADDAKGFAENVVRLYNDSSQIMRISLMSHEYVREVFSTKNAIQVIGHDINV